MAGRFRNSWVFQSRSCTLKAREDPNGRGVPNDYVGSRGIKWLRSKLPTTEARDNSPNSTFADTIYGLSTFRINPLRMGFEMSDRGANEAKAGRASAQLCARLV